MQGIVIEGATITPSEVKAYFERIPQDSLPYFSAEVEVGEVVQAPEVNSEERQNALDKLQSLKDQIESGASFVDLAEKFSDDLGSARVGGDLGLQRRGTFVPEFEAAAYNLEEGELSNIIETPFGFHLIELLERRGNLIHTRHILIKPNITDSDLAKAVQRLDSIGRIIVEDSILFEVAVKKFSDEDEQSYNNGGRMINSKTGNTFFEISELDPDIFFTLDTMSVGDLSHPIAFTKPTGEKAYRIVLLQSRTDPHRANLKQDYTKIKNAAIEERKTEYLDRWLTDKIASTFVQIDPAFLSACENLAQWSTKHIKP